MAADNGEERALRGRGRCRTGREGGWLGRRSALFRLFKRTREGVSGSAIIPFVVLDGEVVDGLTEDISLLIRQLVLKMQVVAASDVSCQMGPEGVPQSLGEVNTQLIEDIPLTEVEGSLDQLPSVNVVFDDDLATVPLIQEPCSRKMQQ